MGVAKTHHGEASLRPAFVTRTGVGIDEEGRDTLQAAGLRNRGDVAREPAVRSRVIGTQDASVWFRSAQQPGDHHFTRHLAPGSRSRLLALGRNETAIHEDDPIHGLKRCEHPRARTQNRQRIHQRLAVVEEYAARPHATVPGILKIQRCPLGAGRHCHGRRMDPRLDAFDQVALPAEPLDLPRAQTGEQQRARQAQDNQDGPFAAALGHSPWLDWGVIMPGIMFAFR